MHQPENNPRTWIGIPSVPPERAAQAFASFYLAIAAAIAIDVLLIVHNHGPETWQLVAERVFDDGSSIVAWALAMTWPTMEAMRMVIARIMEKRTFLRGRAQGIEEGLEMGREETNRLWEAWYNRRLQAEARGEPFDEPRPGTDGDGTA